MCCKKWKFFKILTKKKPWSHYFDELRCFYIITSSNRIFGPFRKIKLITEVIIWRGGRVKKGFFFKNFFIVKISIKCVVNNEKFSKFAQKKTLINIIEFISFLFLQIFQIHDSRTSGYICSDCSLNESNFFFIFK